MWTAETHRIYARAYAAARRDGQSKEFAAALARRAIGKTGLKPKAIRTPEDHIVVDAAAAANAKTMAGVAHLSITAALMGDPLPGRSAFDRQKGA